MGFVRFPVLLLEWFCLFGSWLLLVFWLFGFCVAGCGRFCFSFLVMGLVSGLVLGLFGCLGRGAGLEAGPGNALEAARIRLRVRVGGFLLVSGLRSGLSSEIFGGLRFLRCLG